MKVKSKSKKINKAWMFDHLNDTYVKLAKKEGYRARAAYKLQEIDEELKLFKPGQLVVDLGSTPGAWSQYVQRQFAAKDTFGGTLRGTIIGLDVLPMEPIDGVDFILGDFREIEVLEQLVMKLAGRRVDVAMSDMAPNLSGIASSDSARTSHLVELALQFAQAHLNSNGVLVCKAFHGSGYNELVKAFKDMFRSVKSMKPKASRDKSSETFLVGVGLKSASPSTDIPK